MTVHNTTKTTELVNDLAQFIGTEQYYRNPLFSDFLYTDGIKYLAEQAGAYWLIDLIAGFQQDKRVKARWEDLQDFQLWVLRVAPDKFAKLICEDGNDFEVLVYHLGFTDFPLPEIKLYVESGVLLLPSEH